MFLRRTAAVSTVGTLVVVCAFASAGFGQSRWFAQPPLVPGSAMRAPAGTSSGQSSEAAPPDQEEEAGIRDNSFMVEEAYNQEPGVVQHIFNFVPAWDASHGLRTRTFDWVFTQEWPVFGQRHQFSYTLPMQWIRQSSASQAFEGQGFGDMLLNYRLQVWNGEDRQPAFAPRFSIILPTGDERDGLGNGEVGYQVNLPMSWEFERWIYHTNAGLTVVPGVVGGVELHPPGLRHTLNGYNLGFSVIRKLRPFFHLMLETVALWDEGLDELGAEDHHFELLILPGFRWAPYTEGSTQWVLGAGVPVGLTRDSSDIAIFLYMSFEHRICPERKSALPAEGR